MHSTANIERELTLDEYGALAEASGAMDELVGGRLVREPRPAFEHGRVQAMLASRLLRHVEENGLGGVVLTESGFVLSHSPPTVRGPDVAYVAPERLESGRPEGWADYAPDLAVEVLSPGDAASAVQAKVIDYLRAGSRLVWVVDPMARTVTVYRSRSDIRVVTPGEPVDGGEVLPGLQLDPGALFAG